MTGFTSKRQAALDKAMTRPVESDYTSQVAYTRALEAYCDGLAQPEQEPVAWAVYDKRGGSKSLHWSENHSPNGDATMFDAVPLVPQRPWVGLTEDEIKAMEAPISSNSSFYAGALWADAKLKEKNNG